MVLSVYVRCLYMGQNKHKKMLTNSQCSLSFTFLVFPFFFCLLFVLYCLQYLCIKILCIIYSKMLNLCGRGKKVSTKNYDDYVLQHQFEQMIIFLKKINVYDILIKKNQFSPLSFSNFHCYWHIVGVIVVAWSGTVNLFCEYNYDMVAINFFSLF